MDAEGQTDTGRTHKTVNCW